MKKAIALALAIAAAPALADGYWTHDSGHNDNRKLAKAKMKCAKKHADVDMQMYCMQKKGYLYHQEAAEEVVEEVTYAPPYFCYQQGYKVNGQPADYTKNMAEVFLGDAVIQATEHAKKGECCGS